MREMNGQFEEVKFGIERITERMDRLVADVDLRLRALEEGRTVGGAQISQRFRPTGNTAASAEPVRPKTVIKSVRATSAHLAKAAWPEDKKPSVSLARVTSSGSVMLSVTRRRLRHKRSVLLHPFGSPQRCRRRGGAEPSTGYSGAWQTGFVQLANRRSAGWDARGTVRPCLWFADEAGVAESRDHAASVSS